MVTVRPSEFLSEIILCLFFPYLVKLYFRAAFIAPSLLSAPLFEKNTFFMPVILTSISATPTQGEV